MKVLKWILTFILFELVESIKFGFIITDDDGVLDKRIMIVGVAHGSVLKHEKLLINDSFK